MKLPSTSRPLALSIVLAGLLSFFWPLVTSEPSVAGVNRWSCFQVVEKMYVGELPAPICETCDDPRIRALLALPLTVDLNYLVGLVAGFVLGMSEPATPLMCISLLGGYQCVRGWDLALRIEWNRTLFGNSGLGHVHYNGLMMTHLLIISLLFLVGLDLRDEQRDEESSEERGKLDRLVVAARKPPKVIDAEIVQKGSSLERGPSNPLERHY